MMQWLKPKVKLKLKWPGPSQWENQNPNFPKHAATFMVPPSPWCRHLHGSIFLVLRFIIRLHYIETHFTYEGVRLEEKYNRRIERHDT